MQTQIHLDPMVKAIDLTRVNLDKLNLQDLEAHAVDVLDTIAALNDYVNSSAPKSANARLNAKQLARKLCLHMAHVRDLIDARKSADVMTQSLPSANALCMPLGLPIMGRRSRVIRPLKSADNATSGPIQILSNDPQGHGAKAVWGGEAKEGGAIRQSGEAGR